MPFVRVYDKTTGRKHSVPEHYLDHPVLGANLRKTPLSEKRQRDAGQAATTTNTKTPASGENEKE